MARAVWRVQLVTWLHEPSPGEKLVGTRRAQTRGFWWDNAQVVFMAQRPPAASAMPSRAVIGDPGIPCRMAMEGLGRCGEPLWRRRGWSGSGSGALAAPPPALPLEIYRGRRRRRARFAPDKWKAGLHLQRESAGFPSCQSLSSAPLLFVHKRKYQPQIIILQETLSKCDLLRMDSLAQLRQHLHGAGTRFRSTAKPVMDNDRVADNCLQ
jgi:hypothetical protein